MPTDPDEQRASERQRRERSEAESRRLFRLAGTASEFASAVLGGVALGWLLDRWLGTQPWFLVAGLTVGFATGLFMLVRLSRSQSSPTTKSTTKKDPPPSP